MRVEIDKEYRIVHTHPLFSDWFNIVATCKRENNGLFEMHANNAFIYCSANQLRSVRKQKVRK